MAKQKRPLTPEEREAARRKADAALEKRTAARRKWLALEKRLSYLGTTEEITMHCPVCGQEVTGKAGVYRIHNNWRNTQLEFSMNWVTHDCPQSAMPPGQAYALMRDCGLTLKELQGQTYLFEDEIEGIKRSLSLWQEDDAGTHPPGCRCAWCSAEEG